jgi:hypothetical protein
MRETERAMAAANVLAADVAALVLVVRSSTLDLDSS